MFSHSASGEAFAVPIPDVAAFVVDVGHAMSAMGGTARPLA